VRSGPGEARTILLLHIISVRPSKQPLMVRTFLKVYMELGSYFLFLQEQIKDIIIIKLKWQPLGQRTLVAGGASAGRLDVLITVSDQKRGGWLGVIERCIHKT
jgi:hypothetical protein